MEVEKYEKQIFELKKDKNDLIKLVKTANILLENSKYESIWKPVYEVYSEDIKELE